MLHKNVTPAMSESGYLVLDEYIVVGTYCTTVCMHSFVMPARNVCALNMI